MSPSADRIAELEADHAALGVTAYVLAHAIAIFVILFIASSSPRLSDHWWTGSIAITCPA